ncbi:Ribonuclease H-like protein [Dioscorea alata]|uniref:Ribonuclease H-like protein n=1 Tax=Dioscorea alata TaxID=55571 RepID=A0ACB7UZ58_DIOAL|nr:Ribonuclease H-like protein [Dioscorea alata]
MGPCQPIGHNFPQKQQGKDLRSFKEVCVEKDGAYCFYCYLFKQSRGDKLGIDAFTKTGFSNWKKAMEIFTDHVSGVNSYHNNARQLCEDFKKAKANCVTYNLFSYSTNRGKFFEMLNWYGKKVQSVGRVINENAPRNNQMTSPQIQKELVKACAEETTRAIINEIGDSHFSILLDESRGKSAKEKMVMIMMFVNKQGHVIERFLAIEHVVDTSTPSLKIALDGMFGHCGLSISRLRGQRYDGASNMKGQFNGLKTLFLNENSFDALLQKHHDKIVEKLERGEIFLERGQHQEDNFARLGDTRWGSHYTTLVPLFTMWESILEVLENVCSECITSGLIQRMESFKFIFILHLIIKVLGLTYGLSNALQQKDQNIVYAMGLIVIVKELLQDLRENGWSAFLEEVKSISVAMSISVPNIEDSIPVRSCSRCGGQLIFIAMIDLLTVEMKNHFSETSTKLLRCIACLDPRNSFSKFDHSMLVRLAHIYSDDFSTSDHLILKEQLHMYIHDVRGKFFCYHDLASLAVKMVQTDKHLTFSLVYRLIELALILPVATTIVERAFSAMNIIKIDLRNKIGDEWLNNMMVCYIEREMFAKIDEKIILIHLSPHSH